jgi:hypothetical protein
MPELLAAVDAVLAAARDWATLLFAGLAAWYGWKIDRDRRRDRSVAIDGFARRVGDKTLRIDLDVRNGSRSPIRLERLEVLRPAQSVLAMQGVHEPGPGPIACRHVVPASSRGGVSFLLGSPQLDAPIAVRCRFRRHAARLALPNRRTVAIDPTAVPAGVGPAGAAEGERPDGSVDDGVGGDEQHR